MRGLPSILSLFGKEFNKFNNTSDPINNYTGSEIIQKHECYILFIMTLRLL